MRALITGVTGQDGSYLAEHLTTQGYDVFGMVRGHDNPKADWIKGLVPGITLIAGDLTDPMSLNAAVRYAQPDEVYNLGAISAPSQAWGQPFLTADVTGLGPLRLFDAVQRYAPDARVVQASSIALHGPYGAAKGYAHAIAADYRQRGLAVSCAVFGGHHSPRRGKSFFSRKVTRAAARIAAGLDTHVVLGALTRVQDWGWADDFVTTLPMIAALEPDNYTVSAGTPHGVQEWVEVAFSAVGLGWHDHVKIDDTFGNLTDVATLHAQPDPRLPWTPRQDFAELAAWMVAEGGTE